MAMTGGDYSRLAGGILNQQNLASQQQLGMNAGQMNQFLGQLGLQQGQPYPGQLFYQQDQQASLYSAQLRVAKEQEATRQMMIDYKLMKENPVVAMDTSKWDHNLDAPKRSNVAWLNSRVEQVTKKAFTC